MHARLRTWAITSFLAMCASMGTVRAGPITDLFIFGDSLSDTGNVLTLTTVFQPPPFPAFPGAEGRFSNGPVWVEHVASGLGLAPKAAPSNLIFNGSSVVPIGPQGGQNFSFGGARTGLSGSAVATTGLLGQWIAWNGGGTFPTRAADPNALYIVAAGANDLRDFRSGIPGAISPVVSAVNIVNILGLLAQAGAQHFLVANQADLGKTPEAALLGRVSESTAATIAFNAALGAALSLLDADFLATVGVDLDIATLDVFGLTEAVHADATTNGGALFGITNVSLPCIDPVSTGNYFAPGSTDINCGVSAYSDDLHPSAVQHRLIGQLALGTPDSVPEPGILMLLVIAAISLIGARLRSPSSQF
jgi:phospholipase/lecithinase/hemolysin